MKPAKPIHSQFKDITGQKFGRLTVTEYAGQQIHPSGQIKSLWLCLCDCGQEITTQGAGLQAGRTKSCGCYQKDKMRKWAQSFNAAHPPRPIADRFWEKVDRSGGPDACWPWSGKASHKFGYGMFNIDTQSVTRWSVECAHRVAYELTYGPIPPGKGVLHGCDNPPCCNPKHLSLGTQLDNSRDAVERNRTAKGEGHGMHKLTESEVLEIRAMGGSASQTMIARKFHVSRWAITDILSGKNWKHLT